jgi:hypothetical protein
MVVSSIQQEVSMFKNSITTIDNKHHGVHCFEILESEASAATKLAEKLELPLYTLIEDPESLGQEFLIRGIEHSNALYYMIPLKDISNYEVDGVIELSE